MSQESVNIILAVLVALMPVITLVAQRVFSRNKDNAEYSSDLLRIANDATDSLRKAREELTTVQDNNEKTVDTMRLAHDAAVNSLRTEYDGRHQRLKQRIEELEKVQKIYAIRFDLVTHPNVQIQNVEAHAMDDVSASQKMKTITVIEHGSDTEKNS